jgi:hypothetical protein
MQSTGLHPIFDRPELLRLAGPDYITWDGYIGLHFQRNVMGRFAGVLSRSFVLRQRYTTPGAGMGPPIAKVKFPLILPTAGSR